MRKGVWGAILIFFLITIGVAIFSYALGTGLSRQGIAKRSLFEASIISESDRVETYTRSFLRATELSSLQAIYDSGTGYIILPYDFNAIYSQKYRMPYWQVYEKKYIPPPEIMFNKIRQEVSWISSCYLYDYLKAFRDFSEATESEINVPEPESKIILNVISIGDQTITVEGDQTLFQKTTRIEDREIDIKRSFNPYSNISTKFGKIIEITWDTIYNNDLGSCIAGKAKEDDAQDCLNKTDEILEKKYPGINFTFKIMPGEFRVAGSQARAIVNVTIYDNSINYTFYSFPNDNITVGFLGINFLAKAGDLTDTDDEVQASSLIYDCAAPDYSGLGIISPKPNMDDICKFFKVNSTTCSDSGNDIYVREECTDFTGSYEDTCVDSTLYQYKCQPSNVCNYDTHDCGAEGCTHGICGCGSGFCKSLLNLINSKFSCVCGDVCYDPVADVNKNKQIDLSDSFMVSKRCGDEVWCQERFNDNSDPC